MYGFRFITGFFLLWLAFSSTIWASKRIVVDLTNQVAIAYQDGKVKFYGRISSGKPGRETPTGHFYVREKDIDHVSNLWPKPNGGAKMHYMLRITRDGVAMHLGNTPDYPASHGCIRMQDGFAQRMYAWADKYTKVDIIGKAPAHSPALHLPAYARSKRMLSRSVGGGTHGPMAALSSNPKDKVDDLSSVFTSARTSSKRSRRAHAVHRNAHPNPLSVVSGHAKRSAVTTRKTRKAHRSKARRKKSARRSKTRRSVHKFTHGDRLTSSKKRRSRLHRKKKHTKRHPHPLSAIGGHR